MTGRPWRPEDLLQAHARAAPDDAALLDDQTVVNWAELEHGVAAAADALATERMRPSDLVALLPARPARTIQALLGVLRAGGVAMPVPSGLTQRELGAAMAMASPAMVVAPDGLGTKAEADRVAPRRGREPEPQRPALHDDAAVVVLTSGTEGLPKGVILSAAALAASADGWLAALPPATGWLLAVSPAHVAGIGVVWRALRARVPIRLAPAGDPVDQLAALRSSPPVSHVSLVPAQLSRLLDAASGDPPPPGLRAVLLGGGPIPADLVIRALELGWPVVPTYGLSEAGSGVTALPASEIGTAPASVGRPLPGVEIRIEDPDADGVGEIVVATPAGFSGYLRGPARHRLDPIHTGDLGRIDSAGRLHVADRRLDRIVSGGENVSPLEVEAVLGAHPAVAEAAVVGRPDPIWGQVPLAGVVLRPGALDPGDRALAAHARASLAGFKVPVAWVRLDALPRTAAGKLQRDALRALIDGSTAGILARPGGDRIGWRLTGRPTDRTLAVLALPGTLSTAMQLEPVAAALSAPGDVAVHALDRRGSGTSRLGRVGPVDVGVHVADLIAYLDARGVGQAAVVGISFGAVLALELAARHPDRVLAVVAWEPPYGALGDEAARAWFREVADRTAAAHRSGGPAAAAETFLRAVAGDAAWERLSDRARALLAAEGDGALADAALLGLDPGGLARITAPAWILTGRASRPGYRTLADAVAARISGSRRRSIAGLSHSGPLTDPTAFAAAVRAALGEAGVLPIPEPAR
jgi:O-succinylbenzoic acid--CoA ligase